MHPAIPADLPINEVLPDLLAACDGAPGVVLEAPPGAGKTTAVPLALLHCDWLGEGRILMLEPRRMAARSAAQRMADLLGEPVGRTVGYRIRLDVCVSEHTRIEVITEGILARQLQSDPTLEGVSMIIFDEFHERSLDSDLALALALQAQDVFREPDAPLRLLVMSATLDGEAVAQLLGNAPRITAQGRQHPVDVSFAAATVRRQQAEPEVVKTVMRALHDGPGSVLVFLPGQGEIRRCLGELRKTLAEQPPPGDTVEVVPLYGGLTLADQQRAIASSPRGERKVVLATNLAETSLTIEGIQVVVDSGLARVPVYDVARDTSRLATRRISRAAAEQRAGRAGRLGPGRCYRLWTEQEQDRLVAQTPPEILASDLGGLALQLLAWGAESAAEFRWMDAPPPNALDQAQSMLLRCGAAFHNALGRLQLTPHGLRMAQLPMSPRTAHMLLLACDMDARERGARLAALLAERRPLPGVDLGRSLAILEGRAVCPPELRGWLQRTQQLARRYDKQCHAVYHPRKFALRVPPEDVPAVLIASAWPDRIARLRGSGNEQYQLANRRSARLPDNDSLQGSSWLAVADSGGRLDGPGASEDQIFAAFALRPERFDDALAPLVQDLETADWDERKERFIAERRRVVGDLVLRREPMDEVTPEARQRALLGLLRRRGMGLLPWTDELRQWQARVNLLQRHGVGGNAWPDCSDEQLLATADTWLTPWLDPVRKLTDFQRLDLRAALHALLPWPLPLELERLAPERLAVPSGNSAAIDYSQDPPVLAVKLQEMFGCEETPVIADGAVPLVVHLLSPARRPLQVTQDLASFWRNGYDDVKKEMKGRYPKHPWPDDPLQAVATARTRHRPA